jgi:hypothetical protein
MEWKIIGLIIDAVIIAILFEYSTNTIIYSSPSPGIIAKSNVAITLASGKTRLAPFSAYHGGSDSGQVTLPLRDGVNITIEYGPPLPALFLGSLSTEGRIESGKWVNFNVVVTNRQVATYEAEVRVEAPSPFRVEPKGIIKICDASGGVFTFRITVDTLNEVTGTLIITLYYEGELLDTRYLEVTGYPPRKEESSAMPFDSLFFVAILTIVIFIVSIYLIIERRRRSIYMPTPPPPPAYYCPTCGNPLTYMPRYRRWYCYNCRKYV